MKWIIGFIAFVAEMLYIRKRIKAPVTISFKVRARDWGFPLFIMFIMVFAGIVIETEISGLLYKAIGNKTFAHFMLREVIDGGVLIPVYMALLSLWLSGYVTAVNLDYSSLFSSTTINLFFSCVILCGAIPNIAIVYYAWLNNEIYSSFMGRIGLWIISILGFWCSVDRICMGRIAREKWNIKRKSDSTSKLEKIKYYLPMFASVAVSAILTVAVYFWGQVIENALDTYGPPIIGFMALGLLVGIIISIYMYPGERLSKWILSKTLNTLKKGESARKRYKKLIYQITRLGEDKRTQYLIEIEACEVIFAENQARANSIFANVSKTFATKEQILEFLSKNNEDRAHFLNDEYIKLKNEAKNALIG